MGGFPFGSCLRGCEGHTPQPWACKAVMTTSNRRSHHARQVQERPAGVIVSHWKRHADAAPSSSLDASETTDHHSRPQSRFQRRIHSGHQHARWRVIDAFAGSGSAALAKRADRIADCCQRPAVCLSSSGSATLITDRCRDRMCPHCQVKRAAVVATAIELKVCRLPSLRFATLTIAADDRTLSERIDHLMSSFRRLRRMASWSTRVRGGIYAIEATRGRDGVNWHVHLHLLITGDFYPQTQLSDDWAAATGDSMIVDIRACHDRRSTAKYVAKYVAKPQSLGSWSDDVLCEFATAFHGKRMTHTFGSLHGVSTDEPAEPREPIDHRTRLQLDRLEYHAERGCPVSKWILVTLERLGPAWRRVLAHHTEYQAEPIPPPPAEDELLALQAIIRTTSQDSFDHRSHAERTAHLEYCTRLGRQRMLAQVRARQTQIW